MTDFNRRDLLTGTTALAGLTVLASPAAAQVPAGRDPFDYEVTHTEAEWREMLGGAYYILREGRTEAQYTSTLWDEARDGTYACAGCDLIHYTSSAKREVDKGWVFFKGSEPNSQLMSQDQGRNPMGDNPDFAIEVHCRRCGSHTGHVLLVEAQVLHCINGAALKFTPETA